MKPYYIYVVALMRTDLAPYDIIKIGISQNPINRLFYNGSDEPYPIWESFPHMVVLKVIEIGPRYKAEAIEQFIMNLIKRDAKYFHNWYELPAWKKITGITEMRIWNDQEVEDILLLVDKCVKFFQ
jgi:hypothetical protein